MNKFFNVAKYILEFSIPVIFSFAIVTLADEKYVYVEEYVFPMQILYFIILFLEWIRRFQNKENEGRYEKYIWIGVILIIFYFSMQFLELFPEN